MKKAKLSLIAIAVLAVAGGTLAFKAQKTFGATIYVGPHAGALTTASKPGWTLTEEGFGEAAFATAISTTTVVATYITQKD